MLPSWTGSWGVLLCGDWRCQGYLEAGSGAALPFLVSLGRLLYVPLSPGQHRLGGTALAQCFSQLGEHAPDLDLPENLVRAFQITQGLLKGEWALVYGSRHVAGVPPEQ